MHPRIPPTIPPIALDERPLLVCDVLNGLSHDQYDIWFHDIPGLLVIFVVFTSPGVVGVDVKKFEAGVAETGGLVGPLLVWTSHYIPDDI